MEDLAKSERIVGTHNSCTGEPSTNFISKLLVPFARCQTKTIAEQIDYGVRLFDIRVKYNKDGDLIIAHGLWTSKTKLWDVLNAIAKKARTSKDKKIYVRFIYETKFVSESQKEHFRHWIGSLWNRRFIILSATCKPTNEILYLNKKQIEYVPTFIDLTPNYHNFYWLLPIPWLWNKIGNRVNKVKSNNILADFV